ncbi:hypothetical protein EGW08_018897, partial [Elysia chlorotica]
MGFRVVQMLGFSLAMIALTSASPRVRRNPHEAKNRCSQEPNAGTHLYADPDDCSKYFTCSNGVNFLMSCPANLHFSNRHQTCVHRGSRFDECEIEQAIQKCRDGFQGIIPHPHVCQRYFNCSIDLSQQQYMYRLSFLPFEDECFYPEVFDSVTGKCMSNKNATCAGISKPKKYYCDYKRTGCPVAHCIPCRYRAGNCEGLADGYHVHSSKGYPRFMRCEDGYYLDELVCPTPHHFDPSR